LNPFGEYEKTLMKVKTLFDFQRFADNAHLASLAAETESRYLHELNEEELDFVSAAGDMETRQKISLRKGELP